jgi:iron complex outermembrane receptor protein
MHATTRNPVPRDQRRGRNEPYIQIQPARRTGFAGDSNRDEPVAAAAQDTPAQAEDSAATADDEGNEIIVTGTSRGRAAMDTPLAVTALDSGDLRRLGATGQADILNSVPTIKADGGGGEVAANVFVKGLPSGGQYQFTPLMYDGIPVMSTFGLNSSAFDVYYRNDLGLERLEFVRGGVSNLFGPGSVAGMINYISATGTDNFEGTAQLEVAERGRYKGDLAASGPLGGGLYYAVSGWYRTDDGPVKTGLDTKGWQVRGNLKYELPDDSGSITLYGQYIDDQAQFYLPIPLDGKTRKRIAGNDGKTVYSVQTPAVAGLGFNTPDRPFTTDITDGVTTKGGQIALAFDKQFGGGWAINGKAKYSQYAHKFGLWSDGDGVINVPETQQSFLTNRGLGSLANASFTYVGGGAVASNALLFANRFTDRDRPMHDYTGELNLTKDATTGALTHTFTLGTFYANAWARDINVTTTYLAEFNNQPRLVNLVANGTVYSRNGLYNAGGRLCEQQALGRTLRRVLRRPDRGAALQHRYRRALGTLYRRH